MKSSLDGYETRSRHRFLALSILTFAVVMVTVQIRSTTAQPVGSFKVVKQIGSMGAGAPQEGLLNGQRMGTEAVPMPIPTEGNRSGDSPGHRRPGSYACPTVESEIGARTRHDHGRCA